MQGIILSPHLRAAIFDAARPFGGYKMSELYTQTKSVIVNLT